ncbi:protein FAM83H-like isoform X2 [Oncorhynchus masou masou]
MDTFTDVDIFADILDAAMRNVAVYIILDEQNAHHFTSMASNCRVNLENIQFMRVRTVSGVTYHCRSGKTFKGQMMDRFLLTDSRAVLSGNYSFMWSFEKLHRCMAHLFLGQLVTTFDEEFRILFAQSQPLVLENGLVPMPHYSSLSDSQYSSDRTLLFRDPRKFLPIDSSRPVEWARHSSDDRMDMVQNMMPPGRCEPIHSSLDQGPLDMYSNKYSSQQFKQEQQSFMAQGHPMMQSNTMEFAGSKRHSYAEGTYAGHSSSQFTQHQAIHSFEGDTATQNRKIHREQHHYQRTGLEPGYSGYDQFRDQGYPLMDQYSESGYPHGIAIEPPDNYDPVLNYLSSNLAVELGHGSNKLLSPGEGPFSQSNPKRLSTGQPHACQTSPTQQNPFEQRSFFVRSGSDCKTQDPSAKQGMRDWRISSYLSAYDDAGEENIPRPMGNDPFQEPLNPSQGKLFAPLVSDPRFSAKELPKIPGLRLNKPTCPEHSRTLEILVSLDAQTTLKPPSELSSTTEGEKSEEMDVKEPKREESFRRRFNPAIQRTSRLRSSLIFSSQLEQHISQEQTCNSGQHCEETANEEDDPSRLSLTAQVLGKRKSITREPFEWRLKSAIVDNSTIESLKSEDITTDSGDKELTKYLPVSTDKVSSMEQTNSAHEKQIETVESAHPSKPAQVEKPKTIQSAHQASSLSNKSYIDMNDPDSRLFFFKELAAKRKAAKAAGSESSAEKAPVKPVTPFDLKIKEPVTRIEPNLPIATLNPADTSTNKPAPADTSTNKPAPSTEAPPNPADTFTTKPTTSTEAPLYPTDTSIKKTATSTEASSETLETSPVLQENKTSMAKCGSLLDVKEHHSKNKEQQDLQLPKSDSKTFLRDKLSCVDGLLRVSTDTEKIELKNSRNQSVSKVNPRDTSTFLKSTSNQCSFNISPKDFSLYKLSPKKPKSFNPASNELNPSLPLTLTEASSSSYPTPKGLSSTSLTSSTNAAKELSSALAPTLKEPSSSIPMSKQPLPSSKPITVESNIPLSPTQSEPGVSHKQDKTDSKESLSPIPMQSCSSSIPATEFGPPPNPTQTQSSFLPKSTLVGSISSTPTESNTSPKPSTKESLSTIATTELRSSSPKTNPIKSYSSPCPGQHESVLSLKHSKTACNSSPKPATVSNDSYNSSPPSSKHVMEKTTNLPSSHQQNLALLLSLPQQNLVLQPIQHQENSTLFLAPPQRNQVHLLARP